MAPNASVIGSTLVVVAVGPNAAAFTIPSYAVCFSVSRAEDWVKATVAELEMLLYKVVSLTLSRPMKSLKPEPLDYVRKRVEMRLLNTFGELATLYLRRERDRS